MISYLKAENLKFKRTFTKKLIFLTPLVTLLIARLCGIWYQVSAFNNWYIIIFPGFITLMCVLFNQKEEKKLKYRAILSLPISLKKDWIAKNILICLYALIASLILWIGSLSGYILIPKGKCIPLISGFLGSVLIVATSVWQIPLCMFLSKKLGLLFTMLMNVMVGAALNLFMINKSLWWLCPYSITSKLMIQVLGILPNGLLVNKNKILLNTNDILTGVMISVLLFIILTLLTANWFSKQEVI